MRPAAVDLGSRHLDASRADGVLRVLIDRPERRNALTIEMYHGHKKAAVLAERDPAIDVLLVTATGDHFCVGGEMGGRSPEALGGTPTAIHLYVPDADAVFARALAAGAQVRMPLQDMFWGDRYGQVVDPFGHVWAIATHKEDLTPEEIGRRAAASIPR